MLSFIWPPTTVCLSSNFCLYKPRSRVYAGTLAVQIYADIIFSELQRHDLLRKKASGIAVEWLNVTFLFLISFKPFESDLFSLPTSCPPSPSALSIISSEHPRSCSRAPFFFLSKHCLEPSGSPFSLQTYVHLFWKMFSY